MNHMIAKSQTKKYGYISVGEEQFRRLAEQKCLEARKNVSELTGIDS